MRRLAAPLLAAALTLIAMNASAQNQAHNASGLTIVVVEGEDAVNIVQQKTAVAPVVEVRDRNGQPVAGAVVRFAIRNGRASFSGAKNLSVTTNVAGRATATGLTPTGSGALHIAATATFQGQTAALTIAQTNVMTAAEAATAAAGGGAGGGAGGAAGSAASAGSSGGLSATTIGVVGGAVAGGTVAATQVLGGSEIVATYSGPFSMAPTNTRVFRTTGLACTLTESISGTLTMELEEAGATLKGTLKVSWAQSERFLGGVNCGQNSASLNYDDDFESPANDIHITWAINDPANVGGTIHRDFSFSGATNGTTISGTFGTSYLGTLSDSTETVPMTFVPVVLQKN